MNDVTKDLLEALKQAQMALIGYLPGRRNAIIDAAIECACTAIAAAESAPKEPVAELPVNARLLAIATNQIQHIYSQNCPDPLWGPNSRDTECPACQAIIAAESAPKAVRLTPSDIVDALRANGMYEDSRAFQRLFPILEADACAIETAVLRKNGIEVTE